MDEFFYFLRIEFLFLLRRSVTVVAVTKIVFRLTAAQTIQQEVQSLARGTMQSQQGNHSDTIVTTTVITVL